MRFLLDESADYPLALYLRSQGHDVTAIVRDYSRGVADQEVLALAYSEHRILVTNDSDFGELVFRQRHLHAGVIYFRTGDESVTTKIRLLAAVLAHHNEQLADHCSMVVTEQLVRVRPNPSPPARSS